MLAQVAHQAAQLTGADKAAIWRIDEAVDELRIVADYELGSAYTSRTLRMGEGVVGQAVARRAPVMVRDALDDDLITVPRALIEQEGIRAMFSVPLIAGDRVLGAISLYSTGPTISRSSRRSWPPRSAIRRRSRSRTPACSKRFGRDWARNRCCSRNCTTA